MVDYRQLPAPFDRYSDADQARILSRMIAIFNTTQANLNLEADALPYTLLPLAEALQQFQALPTA